MSDEPRPMSQEEIDALFSNLGDEPPTEMSSAPASDEPAVPIKPAESEVVPAEAVEPEPGKKLDQDSISSLIDSMISSEPPATAEVKAAEEAQAAGDALDLDAMIAEVAGEAPPAAAAEEPVEDSALAETIVPDEDALSGAISPADFCFDAERYRCSPVRLGRCA